LIRLLLLKVEDSATVHATNGEEEEEEEMDTAGLLWYLMQWCNCCRSTSWSFSGNQLTG